MNRRHLPTPGYTSAAVGSSVMKMTNVSYGISKKLGQSLLPVRSTTVAHQSHLLSQRAALRAQQHEDEKFKTTAKQIAHQPFMAVHQKLVEEKMRQSGKFEKRAKQIVHMPLLRHVAGAGSVVVVPQSVATNMLHKAKLKKRISDLQTNPNILNNPNAPSILLNDRPVVTPIKLFKKTATSVAVLASHPLFKPVWAQERAKHKNFKSVSRTICRTMRLLGGVHDDLAALRERPLVGSNEKKVKSGAYPLLRREILERLFEYLSVEDLKTCRLVCEFWCRFASTTLQKKSVVRLSGNCDICKSEYMSTDEAIQSHEHIETISFYKFVLFILEIPQEKRYFLPYRQFKIRKLNLYFIQGLNTEPTRVFLMFLKIWADKIHHLHLQFVHMCPPDSFYRILDSCTRLHSVTFDSSNFWLDPLAPTVNQPFIMKVNYYLTSITFISDWICEELLHWQMIFHAFPKLEELNLCDMSKAEINHCLSIILNLPDADEEEELRKTQGFKSLSKKMMFQPFITSPGQAGEEPTEAVSFKKVTRLCVNMPYREMRQEKLDQLREEAAQGGKTFKSTALNLLHQPFGLFSKKEMKAMEKMMKKSVTFRGLAKHLVHQPFSISQRLSKDQKSTDSVDEPSLPPPPSIIQPLSKAPSFKGLKGLASVVQQRPFKARGLVSQMSIEKEFLRIKEEVAAAAAAEKEKVKEKIEEETESTTTEATPATTTTEAPPPTPPSSKLSKGVLKGVAGKVGQQPFKSRGLTGGTDTDESEGTGTESEKASIGSAAVTPEGKRKSMKGALGKITDQPFKARGVLGEKDKIETPAPPTTDQPKSPSPKSMRAAAGKVGEKPFQARGIVPGVESASDADEPTSVTLTAQQTNSLKSLFGKKGGGGATAFGKAAAMKPKVKPEVEEEKKETKKEDAGLKQKTRSILNQPFTLVSPGPEQVEETFQSITPFKKRSTLLTKQPFKLTGREKSLAARLKSTAKIITNQPFNLGEAKPKEKVLPGSRLVKLTVALRGKFEDYLKLDIPHIPGETESEEESEASDGEESNSSPIGESDFNDLEINELLAEVVSRFPITHLTLRVNYTKDDAANFPIVLEACRDKLKSLCLTRHPKFYFPELDLQFRINPFEMAEETLMEFPNVTHLAIAHNLVDNINEITLVFPALTHLTVNIIPTEFLVRQTQPYKTYVRTNLMFSMKSGSPNTTVRNLTWSIKEARNPVTNKRTTVYKSNALRHIPRIFPNLSKLCVSITTPFELHIIFRYCPQLHDLIVLKNSFYRTKDEDIIGVEEELLEQEDPDNNNKTVQLNYGIKQLKFLRRLSLQNNNCNLTNLSVRQGFIHLRRLRSLHISRGARIGVKALRVLKRCRFLVHVHVTKEKIKPPRPPPDPTTLEDEAELEQLGLQKIPGYPGYYITLAKPEEPSKPLAKFETSTKYDKLGGKKYECVRTSYTVNGRTYVLVRKQYEYEGERDRQIWATRYRLAEFRKFHEAQEKAVETALQQAAADGLLDPEKIIRDAERRRQEARQDEESDYERFLNDYEDGDEDDEEDGYDGEEEELAEIDKDIDKQVEESSDEDGICIEADTMYEADKEYNLDSQDDKSSSVESYCDSCDTQEYQGDKETGDLSDEQPKQDQKETVVVVEEETGTEQKEKVEGESEKEAEVEGDKENVLIEQVKSTEPEKEKVEQQEKKQEIVPEKKKKSKKSEEKEKKKKERHEKKKREATVDKLIEDALMSNAPVGVEYAALKAFQARRIQQMTKVSSSSSSTSQTESDNSKSKQFVDKGPLSVKKEKSKEKSRKKLQDDDSDRHEHHRHRRTSKDSGGERRKIEQGKEKVKKIRDSSRSKSKSDKSTKIPFLPEVTIPTQGDMTGDMRQALIQQMVKNVRKELRK